MASATRAQVGKCDQSEATQLYTLIMFLQPAVLKKLPVQERSSNVCRHAGSLRLLSCEQMSHAIHSTASPGLPEQSLHTLL